MIVAWLDWVYEAVHEVRDEVTASTEKLDERDWLNAPVHGVWDAVTGSADELDERDGVKVLGCAGTYPVIGVAGAHRPPPPAALHGQTTEEEVLFVAHPELVFVSGA